MARIFKITHDGSHFVGKVLYGKNEVNFVNDVVKKNQGSILKAYFNSLYDKSESEGLKGIAQVKFINKQLTDKYGKIDKFGNLKDFTNYIINNIRLKKAKKIETELKKEYEENKIVKDDHISIFKNLYSDTLKQGFKREEKLSYINAAFMQHYQNSIDYSPMIDYRLNVENANLFNRIKRFRNKAYLNKWNYFTTFTFDDKKVSADEFRVKLRKCLSNLHTRHKWNYSGVWELGEEDKRLHFHCILYVPAGEMVGDLIEKEDYSCKYHCRQKTIQNSHFLEKFGRNDFEEIDKYEFNRGITISYLLKYITKTGDRIVYSRGVPAFIFKDVCDDSIICFVTNITVKSIFFDDVIEDSDLRNQSLYRLTA